MPLRGTKGHENLEYHPEPKAKGLMHKDSMGKQILRAFALRMTLRVRFFAVLRMTAK